MIKSDTHKEIVPALSKLQAELKPAVFDSKNPHFGNRYASFTSVMEAIRVLLAKNGFAVTQSVVEGPALKTVLFHTSGEWFESYIPLYVARNDMQSLGSAITYAKRYAISAMLGVVTDEDDDGNDSKGTGDPKAEAPSKPKGGGSPPTQSQIARLFTIATSSNWTKEEVQKALKAAYGIESTKLLDCAQYTELVEVIQSKSFNEAMKLVGPTLPASKSEDSRKPLTEEDVPF